MANVKPLFRPCRSALPPSIPDAELGDLLDAGQIRQEFFQGRVSREWVLKHVDPLHKAYVGKRALWYRGHVKAWLPVYMKQQQERAQRRRSESRE